jgi:dCMP deaminase
MSKWWDEYFMDIAKRTALQSHCVRLKVGAAAVRDKRIILTGLNGTPPGEDNCCEEEVWVKDESYSMGGLWETVTKDSVSHAEENLITFAAHSGISLRGCGLFLTHSPCIHCAKLIRNSGIAYVVYNELFRSNDGLEYLQQRGIPVTKFSELDYG